uniref:Uncharacterized protein n=1 Tax=Alexandrium catenella TaxID=2925 RepID=A0A7S1SCC1_ALECA|mmetsp:Transcript_95324/g.253222  ORF Transcript_95324/g.253222 Transcript_95324/m.253222 type:complete len:191 (+) Transcript_95324:63-635(+)
MMASKKIAVAVGFAAVAALHCFSGENPLLHCSVIVVTALVLQLLRTLHAALVANAARRANSKIQEEEGRADALARALGAARELACTASAASAWVVATARSRTVRHVAGGIMVVAVAALLRRTGVIGTPEVILISLFCGAVARATLPAEQGQGARCDCCRCDEPCESSSCCPYSEDFWADLPALTNEQEEE